MTPPEGAGALYVCVGGGGGARGGWGGWHPI
jgi:hypothetical protein